MAKAKTRKWPRAAVLCACLSLTIAGQAEPQSKQSATDEPSLPIASISGDWNGDGALDGALLFTSDEDASLFIYFGGQDGSKRTSVLARDIVWHSQGIAGQEAGLEKSGENRIVVTSQNSAIGRDRWSERLTLAFTDGEMKVIGYQRTAYDTLNLDWRQECALDFVAGRGVLNDKPLKLSDGPARVQEWSMESTPPTICDVE